VNYQLATRWRKVMVVTVKAMTLPTQPKSMIIVGSGAIGVEFAHFTIQWY
jgi:pyruvate/2-oxoglutarate dehydrogenase complex dihydrolipoamide dehydrogenase (E3) component